LETAADLEALAASARAYPDAMQAKASALNGYVASLDA
jgi:hypothetical protein